MNNIANKDRLLSFIGFLNNTFLNLYAELLFLDQILNKKLIYG